MDRSLIYIARLLFKTKVYQSDGSAFESLFTQIMQASNHNFQQVKPQGQYGDRKNDGFDKTTGTYYQVYAPEDIRKRERELTDKLETDFVGLYAYWQAHCPIRQFFFVVNDKYKGAPPSLYVKLMDIEKRYSGVRANVFLAKDLEDKFLMLDDSVKESIVGVIPDPGSVGIEYGVIRDVIEYMLNVSVCSQQAIMPESPDFEKKIIFNNLSSQVALYLRNYRRESYAIDDFFEFHSDFAKENLRDIFNGLYNEALLEIPDGANKTDQVFFYILNKAYSKHTLAIDHAILALMAYYFEYCDIFDAPTV